MRLKREAEQGTGRHGGARPGAGRPVGSHLHAKLTEKTLNMHDVVHLPPNERPTFEVSIGRLTWPNGAQAHLFSAEEPDRLRGPNFDLLWIDELCAIPNDTAVWD